MKQRPTAVQITRKNRLLQYSSDFNPRILRCKYSLRNHIWGKTWDKRAKEIYCRFLEDFSKINKSEKIWCATLVSNVFLRKFQNTKIQHPAIWFATIWQHENCNSVNCALLINLLKILVSFAALYYNSLCVNQWGFQLTFEELQTCYSILNLSLDMLGKSCVFWNSTKDTSYHRHTTKSCKCEDHYKNFHFAKVL